MDCRGTLLKKKFQELIKKFLIYFPTCISMIFSVLRKSLKKTEIFENWQHFNYCGNLEAIPNFYVINHVSFRP